MAGDGTVSGDRDELCGMQFPGGKSGLQSAGSRVGIGQPFDKFHGRGGLSGFSERDKGG